MTNYPFLLHIIGTWDTRIKSLGMTRRAFADLAGVSATQISKIINHKVANPRLMTINRVETTLMAIEELELEN